MFYSGIDLHKDNCFITTVDDRGEIVKQERVRNVPEIILAYFASLDGSHKTVVECTAGWYWLNDLLEAHGIELVLAHAKYLKAISYAKVKTDKVDSQTLAKLRRLDSIPQAHKIRRSSGISGMSCELACVWSRSVPLVASASTTWVVNSTVTSNW